MKGELLALFLLINIWPIRNAVAIDVYTPFPGVEHVSKCSSHNSRLSLSIKKEIVPVYHRFRFEDWAFKCLGLRGGSVTERSRSTPLVKGPSPPPSRVKAGLIGLGVATVLYYLRDQILVYAAIFAAGILSFSALRLRFPQAYRVRSWAPGQKTFLANEQYGFFSWLWKLHEISEDDLMVECGMDAVCYLRLIRMGLRMSLVGVLNALWLLPLYGITKESEPHGVKGLVDQMIQGTVAKVPSGSSRLYATVIAAYIFFGHAMFAISKELSYYIEMRHKYLRLPLPQHFSIFVRNIPREFQETGRLAAYFRGSVTGDDAILEATLPMKTPQLDKTIAIRESTVENLEHVLALHKKTGVRPQNKQSTNGRKVNVDSIDFYAALLQEQNQSVRNQIQKLKAIGTVPRKLLLKDHLDRVMEYSTTNHTRQTDDHGDLPSDSQNTAPNCSSSVEAQLSGSKAGKDGEICPSGFVVFSKIGNANVARQIIHHAKPFAMEILEAPGPEDIYWRNVGRTHRDLQLGKLISFVSTTVVCLLWTVPTTFFASLSNASTARKNIKFLGKVFDQYPRTVPIVETLAPLMVVLFNSLLPTFLQQFTLMEGPVSSAIVNSSLFLKLAIFMCTQTFFVSAISGSVIQALQEILHDWTKIVGILANSLPSQGNYFMQIVLVTTIMGSVCELNRIVPAITGILRKYIGPNLTEKERRKAFLGLRPLSNPPPFETPAITSQLVLFMMVLFVYAVISPVTPVVTALCFLFMGSSARHQFVYIYHPEKDSGGKLFAGFMQVVLSCMLAAQATIFGILGLKKATHQLSLFTPLMCATVLFVCYIRQTHFQVAEFLPSREGFTGDRRVDLSALRGTYVQPSLRADLKVSTETSYQPSSLEEMVRE